MDGQRYIERMEALGYKVGIDGQCFGLSHMALQAFLADDMKSFTNRLQTIFDIPIDDYKDDFSLLRQKQQQFIREGKTAESNAINDNIVNILAFFDGIVLFQDPNSYRDLFSDENKTTRHNALKSSSLVLPLILNTKEKTPVRIQRFAGAYNKEELELDFSQLCRQGQLINQ